MKNFLKVKKQLAFTLAETMIVIVVLGIIATLTIPALVNKNKESVAKTKVRKAMAAYESALNKMIIENDLKDNKPLTDWAGNAENNCANSTNYFKKVQGDGCIFKTSDGIWWNISDIERPVISFKEINVGNEEQITTNANNANDKTAFVLVGRFGTDGSLRVDDLGYETGHDYEGSLAQVQKLYNFLSGKKSSGTEAADCDENDIVCKYKRGDFLYGYKPTENDKNANCDDTDVICKYKRGDTFTQCSGSEDDWKMCEYCEDIYCTLYDNRGYELFSYEYIYDKNGSAYRSYIPDLADIERDIDGNGNLYIRYILYEDENGLNFSESYSLDNNGNPYLSNYNSQTSSKTWELDGNGNVYLSYQDGGEDGVKRWSLDNNGNPYLSYEKSRPWEDGCSVGIDCYARRYDIGNDGKPYKSYEVISTETTCCTKYYNSDGSVGYQYGTGCK